MRSLGLFARVAVLVALVSAVVAAPAGAPWTAAPGTVPANTSWTAGVVCVTSSTCLLLRGQEGVASSALAATWTGSSFSAQAPVSATSQLYDADCGPTLCFTVGNDDGSGTWAPHAETWNGSSFGSSTTTAPSGSTYAILQGVACPSSTACFAAGWYETTGDPQALVESWNGTSWALQSLSLPANTTAAKLLGIACASASACWAVGYVEVTGQPRKTLVLGWNGTAWTTQTSANPAGAGLAQLHSIECESSSACEAVGQYIDGSSVQHALAESWNGSAWSLQSVPDPSGGATDPTLYGVSCAGANACAAVGFKTVSGVAQPMAAGWNGTAWSLESVGGVHGTSSGGLIGVSCPSTCMTVGYSIYDGSTGTTGLRPLVELGP